MHIYIRQIFQIKHVTFAAVLMASAINASAKLPPPTDEEKAKAEAVKQKASADAEVEKEKLSKAQDRVVSEYRKQMAASGKSTGGNTAQGAATQEVPSAALNSRPTEKAGAYNETVTPKTAPGASAGTKTPSAEVPQGSAK